MTTATETKSFTLTKLPNINMALPGPKAQEVIAYDKKFMSPSLTRDYPLVAERGVWSQSWKIPTETNSWILPRESPSAPRDIATRMSWRPFRSRPRN